MFQDFVRYELPLRDNVGAARRARTTMIRAALADAGAADARRSRHDPGPGLRGGTDLSGGQWQRVALARALCAVRLGAGVVLLDEPTAQLDVRGEAEIFERVPRRDAPLHDDPGLAPLLDRAPGRPHLRASSTAGSSSSARTTS